MLHLNSASCWCVRLCDVSPSLDAYELPHMSHTNGFSPVCTRTCDTNAALLAVVRWQYEHANAPLCLRMCVRSVCLDLHRTLHTSQLNAFSAWNAFWWISRRLSVRNSLPHVGQLNSLAMSSCAVRSWLDRSQKRENVMSQNSHV